jgi:hypothetical protein
MGDPNELKNGRSFNWDFLPKNPINANGTCQSNWATLIKKKGEMRPNPQKICPTNHGNGQWPNQIVGWRFGQILLPTFVHMPLNAYPFN